MTQSDYLSRRFKYRERADRLYRKANDLTDRREFFGTVGGLESSDPKMVELQNQIARLQARAGAMERQAHKLYRLAYPLVACQHEHGASAQGQLLICADCHEPFAPRNYQEQGQVMLYGSGQSRRGYEKIETYERGFEIIESTK